MTLSAIRGLRHTSFTTPGKVLQEAFRGRLYTFPHSTQTTRSIQILASRRISNLSLRSHRSFPPHIRLMSSCSQFAQNAGPISELSPSQENPGASRWASAAAIGVAGGAYLYSDPLPEEENVINTFPTPKDGTIERTGPLDFLEQHLVDNGCVVITGDSYTGKTQLALSFAKRNAGEYSRRIYISLAHPQKPLEELIKVEKSREKNRVDKVVDWIALGEDIALDGYKQDFIQSCIDKKFEDLRKGKSYAKYRNSGSNWNIPEGNWYESGGASKISSKFNITRAIYYGLPKLWNYIKRKPQKIVIPSKFEVRGNAFYEQVPLAQDKPLLIIFDNIGEGLEIEDILRELPYQQDIRGKCPVHVIVIFQRPHVIPAFPSLDLNQYPLTDEETIRIFNQKNFSQWDKEIGKELLQECRTSGSLSERQQTEKSLVELTPKLGNLIDKRTKEEIHKNLSRPLSLEEMRNIRKQADHFVENAFRQAAGKALKTVIDFFSKKKDPEQEKLDRQLKKKTIIDLVRSCKGSLLLVDAMEVILQKQPQTLFLDNPDKILERSFRKVQRDPDALSILNTCVYLPAEHIPLECLDKEAPNVLKILKQCSLVNYDEKAGISIPNAVREMVCESVREKKEEGKWLSQASLIVENFPEYFEIYPERVARQRSRVLELQQEELEQSLISLGEKAIKRKDFSSAAKYLQEFFSRVGFIYDLEDLPLEKLMNLMNAASLLGEAYLFQENPSEDDIDAAIKCISYSQVIFGHIAQIDQEIVKNKFKLICKLYFNMALAQKMQGNVKESFQLFLNYLDMGEDFLEGIRLGIKESLSEKDPLDVASVLLEVFQELDPLPSMYAEAVEHAIALGEELEETSKIEELSKVKKITKYIPLVKEFLEIIFAPFMQEQRLAEFIRTPMRKPQEFTELEKFFPALEHLAGFFELPDINAEMIAVFFEKLPEDLKKKYSWISLVPQIVRDFPLWEKDQTFDKKVLEEMSRRCPERKEFFNNWIRAGESATKEDIEEFQQEFEKNIKDFKEFNEIVQLQLESAIFILQKKKKSLSALE